jgi:hypothetical protein
MNSVAAGWSEAISCVKKYLEIGVGAGDLKLQIMMRVFSGSFFNAITAGRTHRQ